MENNNTQIESRFRRLFSVEKEIRTKNKLLSFSLMWMGLAVAIIFAIAWLTLPTMPLHSLIERMSTTSSIILFVIDLILMFVLFFVIRNRNVSTIVVALLFLGFVVAQGFVIATMFHFLEVSNLKDLIPLFVFPGLFFALIGIIGYFNLINFTRWMPFLCYGMFGLVLVGTIGFLVPGMRSQPMNILYTILSFTVFFGWVGFDIQMLIRQGEFVDYSSKEELIRYSLMGGLHLFLDFVNLLLLMLRFIDWT